MWSVSNQMLHMPAGESGGETGAVTVTLVGLPNLSGGGQPTQVQSRVTTQLDSMLQKFRSTDVQPGPGQNSKSNGGAAQLFKEIAEAQAQAAGRQKAEGSVNGQGAANGYDLWAKIRPCWQRASGVVVTLDVGVDDQGRLAWAPRPVRGRRASAGPRELLAESLAVQAAVRCAPYREAAPVMGAKVFRITFAG
jgi:hypothetical protein